MAETITISKSSANILVTDFKIIAVTEEEITNSAKIKSKAETLVCRVTIGGETKQINFNWIDYLNLFETRERSVYVRIPQYGTKRAGAFDENKIYENKVRKAHLYIQKTELAYQFLNEYSILDGKAKIICWTDSPTGLKLSEQEATDNNYPSPIRVV